MTQELSNRALLLLAFIWSPYRPRLGGSV